MRTWTETHREGTNMGPVDWSHPTAKDMPQVWRDAEKNPEAYRFCPSGFSAFQVIAVTMYDGWPYWEPRPALQYVGPLGIYEWVFFDSYGVDANSLFRAVTAKAEPAPDTFTDADRMHDQAADVAAENEEFE